MEADFSFPCNRLLLAVRLGVPTNSSASNRPGRVTAASKDRNRLVATMKTQDCFRRNSFNWQSRHCYGYGYGYGGENFSTRETANPPTCVSIAVVSMRLSIARLGFSLSRQNSSISSNKITVLSSAFRRLKICHSGLLLITPGHNLNFKKRSVFLT